MGDYDDFNKKGYKMKQAQSSKLWTKDFIIISLINFFTHLVFYTLIVITAIYVVTEFNASQSMAGLATGIFVLASLVGRVFAGKYLDRIGPKRILVGSLILFVLAMISHLFANTFILFLAIRFIHGIMHGSITTTAGAISAELIPDSRRGEGTGYYATFMNIAMAIGPFLAMFFYANFSFTAIFILGIIFAVLDLIITIFLKVPQPKGAHRAKQGFHFKDFIEPKALPISFVLFILSIPYSSLLVFLAQYAIEIDLVSASTYFFVVFAVALIVTRPFTGVWFDRFGANRLNFPLLLLLAIGFFLLSNAKSDLSFLLSAVFIGIGFGTILSNFLAIAIQSSPPHRKGLATSTFFISLDLANGIGPYINGILVAYLSFRQLYFTVGAWMLVVIGVYYLIFRKKENNQAVNVKEQHLG